MHDIDRTQMEFNPESGYETEQDESESWAGEGGLLSEADEMQLASELLGVSTEAELDQFLGSLIKKASSAIGSVVRSPIGQAVGGVLKSAAKKALPLAGGALGGYFGGPLGAKIRQRPGLRCWQRAWARGREPGPGGPRVRGRQTVRPLRGQHRAESRGIADGGQPGRGGAGRRHQRRAPVPAWTRQPDRRGCRHCRGGPRTDRAMAATRRQDCPLRRVTRRS